MSKLVNFISNIDWQLQKLLREPVDIEDYFIYKGEKYFFKIESSKGIIFYNQGFNSNHYTGYLKNHKGKNLFYQYWIFDPLSPVFIFNHGNAENSSNHPKFIHFLLINRINVFTFDQEGYGDSDGIRGTISNIFDYLLNFDIFYSFVINIIKHQRKMLEAKKGKGRRKIESYYPDVYIAGYSMGGFLSFMYIYYYNLLLKIKRRYNFIKFNKELTIEELEKIKSIKKLILLSPWFYHHDRLFSKFSEMILKYFNFVFSENYLMRQDSQKKILMGDFELYKKLYKNLTDNDRYLKRRMKDHRIHRLVSMHWLSEFLVNQTKILKSLKNKNNQKIDNFSGEIFLFIGENDLVVNNRISIDIIKKFTESQNIFHMKDFYHDFLDYDDERYDQFNLIFEKILLTN